MEDSWKIEDERKIFTDEKNFCRIDFSSALWMTGHLTEIYGDAKLNSLLSSVDAVAETNDFTAAETDDLLLLVEYKNATIAGARGVFDPESEETLKRLAKKYFDSLHYARARQQGKTKRKVYVWIVETPGGDSALRNRIHEKLRAKLPFKLQEQNPFAEKLIDALYIVDIKEWNRFFKQFPIFTKQGEEFVPVNA